MSPKLIEEIDSNIRAAETEYERARLRLEQLRQARDILVPDDDAAPVNGHAVQGVGSTLPPPPPLPEDGSRRRWPQPLKRLVVAEWEERDADGRRELLEHFDIAAQQVYRWRSSLGESH